MTRRAVALVLVLVVLVMASTAVAGAARVVTAARAAERVEGRSRTAESLRVGAEEFVLWFLRSESTRVVVAADARTPAVNLVDQQLEIGGERCRVTVTAYDQCGMAPWGEVRRGSPVRSGVPRDMAAAWDRRESAAGPPSIDMLTKSCAELGVAVFPDRGTGEVAAGSMLATHNPDPTMARIGGSGLVNVNTAPRELLEAAFRSAGASGAREVLEQRQRGGLASAPGTSAVGAGGLRLVSQSDCWSFRVDVRVGGVMRSWWSVYRATGTEWRCVQRVAISE